MSAPQFEQVFAAIAPEGVSLALADESSAVSRSYPDCQVIDFDRLALWTEQANDYAPMTAQDDEGPLTSYLFMAMRGEHEEGLFAIRASSPQRAIRAAETAFPALSMKLLGPQQGLERAYAMAWQLVERSQVHLASRDLRGGGGRA